jgi:hypothetical protein
MTLSHCGATHISKRVIKAIDQAIRKSHGTPVILRAHLNNQLRTFSSLVSRVSRSKLLPVINGYLTEKLSLNISDLATLNLGLS